MHHRRIASVVIGLVMLAACGGSGADNVTDVPSDSADFARVASVTVSLASSSIQVGGTTNATAVVRDMRGRVVNNSAAWSTSNASIATVSSSGVVTAVAAGSANIVATVGGKNGSAAVTVATAEVPAPGATTDLAAAATGSAAVTLTFSQVNNGAGAPSSYDVRFATAPMSWGAATSVSNGTCSTPLAGTATNGTLTCTVLGLSPSTTYDFQLVAYRGTLAADAVFGPLSNVAEATTPAETVNPVPTTVTVAPTSASLAIGAAQTFTATVKDQNGATMTCGSLSWSSQNTSVVTINASGTATGVAAGNTTVKATCGAASGTAAVAVTAAPPVATTVTVAPSSASIAVAATQAFTATVKDQNGATMTCGALTWSSQNTSVATISASGTATGVAAGSTTVKASCGSANGSANITVTAAPPVATTVVVSPTSASIAAAASQAFTATVKDQNGATMSCPMLGWTSQNTSVVTINASGSATGVAAGATTVKAACGSASGTANVTVTAVAPPAGDTIFYENWESNSFAKWQDGYKPATQKIDTDAGAYEGSRYLDVTYSPSQDGGWLTTWFMPGYDSLYVRAYIKLSTNWTGGTKFLGFNGSRTDNMWSAFGTAGKCPNGTDFFTTSAVTDPNGGTSTMSPPSRIYTYFPGMAREPDGVTCWGRYGDGVNEHYYEPTQISFGVWHKVEFWVRINAVGQSNGSQKLWIDGRLIGEWPNVQFRTSTILKLNSLQLVFSSINPGNGHMYVDDILVLGNKPSP